MLFLENWSAASRKTAYTLATRLLAAYTREESPSENLIKLVYYVVKVYAPSWFEIKSSSKLRESPRILFQNLLRIDQLSFEDVNHSSKAKPARKLLLLITRKLSVCIDKR